MTGNRGQVHSSHPSVILSATELARDRSRAGRYAAAFAAERGTPLIQNDASRLGIVRIGDRRFPIAIADGSYGGAYVASPHSAYVLYARDELDILGVKATRWAAQGALTALDLHLRAMRINQAVHLDNWLLSTNLHGDWNGATLPDIRDCVASNFPGHFIVLRSLDGWSCPTLLKAAQADGWVLVPSRQIWVTDDLAADWKPRSHTASDRRKLRKSGLRIEEPETLDPIDAERIANLYHALYLDRYTRLNPAYTSEYIMMAARTGVLRFRVARNSGGTIMAAAGMSVAGDIVTVPLLGYDMTRPKAEALYRIASYLSSEWALEHGYRHHGSSGAGTFKQNRGARSEIEFMAVHAGHLPPARRAGLRLLSAVLKQTMVPLLKSNQW